MLILLLVPSASWYTWSCQSVLAAPNIAFCVAVPLALTTDLNCAAFSTLSFLVRAERELTELRLTLGAPLFPFLVVMRMTPLAALVP